ncbi:MAG: YbdK family carboxylate-amine ligase [Gammaproteobacteria bacterium]|jgi:carboxylate-amine ligase|nr:YbdK family carboxylate-amine ligase [Gammaproteobacteria bacterium]
MEFKATNPFSIGMELELQLVDSRTLNLADRILPLMEFYPDSPYVKPEFIQNTVEIASKVCDSASKLQSHVTSLVSELSTRCRKLGTSLCGAGSHPFCERLALITPLPRYLKIEESTGYVSHTQITFATHVHIGMTSGDEAIALLRGLKPYLPLLIAVSANSPFWRGYDTSYASYRHRILAATRSYGIPPSFQSWADFSHFFDTSRRAGMFETINDIHWDIRPRPHLGTLEIRVMDAQSTVSDAIALAAFVRALIVYLRRTQGAARSGQLLKPLPWWIEKNNHFQASRLGLDAMYVSDEQGRVRPLVDIFREVTDAVAVAAEELGETRYLQHLTAAMESGPGYTRQRRIYRRTASLKCVVSSLVDRLKQDTLPRHSSDCARVTSCR